MKFKINIFLNVSSDTYANRREIQGRQGPADQSRPSPATVKSNKQIALGSAERLSAIMTEVFRDFPQL